jgi:hypothetical protein
VTLADFISEVGQYFKDDLDGNPGLPPYYPGYKPQADMDGNGQIRINDILTVLFQFGTLTSCQDKPISPKGTPPPTPTPGPSLAEMSLTVKSAGAVCDVPAKPTKCAVAGDSPFTLSVEVNAAPAGGYVGFQTQVDYGSLVYKPAAGEVVWPSASGPRSQDPVWVNRVNHSAASGAVPPLPVSTYTGNIVDLQLTCPGEGEFPVDLALYVAGTNAFGTTFFTDNYATRVLPDPVAPNVADTLTINCGPLPQVLGALGMSGNTATLQAGSQVRWVCDPNDNGASVAIRFSYDWGTQDIEGTGRTSVTQVPPTNVLNSVQCVVEGLPGPKLMIDWFQPLAASGVIFDSTSLLPVLGATVLLQIEYSPGLYRDVDPIYDAAFIEPDVNPETTDLLGRYAWTVAPGNYRVVVNPAVAPHAPGGIASSAPCAPGVLTVIDNPDQNIYVDCDNHDTDLLPDFAELITESDPTLADSPSFGCFPFPPLPCFTGVAGVPDDAENPDGDNYSNFQEILLGYNPLVNENGDDDGDGCPNGKELQTAAGSQTSGGRRDPYNPYDYFEPTHNHQNRIDDVLKVVHQFFIDSGNLAYNPDTDRTYVGPNPWNLGPPNGQQRVDDILHSVHQFFQDCA